MSLERAGIDDAERVDRLWIWQVYGLGFRGPLSNGRSRVGEFNLCAAGLD